MLVHSGICTETGSILHVTGCEDAKAEKQNSEQFDVGGRR